MGIFKKFGGIVGSSFQLGLTGPLFRDVAGVIEARNSDDSAYAIFRGADPVDANDLVTKQFGDSTYGGGATLTGVWRFDSTITTGPASGRFRQDNAVYGSVTELFISDTTRPGFDATNILAFLSAGDRLYIQRTDNAAEWAVWDVNAAVTDEGNWFRIPVTLVANGLALTNNRDASITILLGGGVGGLSHGSLAGLTADDHAQYPLLAGRATGQFLTGGTAVSEELTFRGTVNANLGLVRMQSPMVFDDVTAANALQPYSVSDTSTQSFSAAFIGGTYNASPIIDFANGVFIWEGLRVAPNIQSLVAPSFAAFTLLQALPTLRAGPAAGQNPLNAAVMNAGPAVQNEFTGTKTVGLISGINFAPQTRATLSGAVLNTAAITAVRVGPTHSTVAGASISHGVVRGMQCIAPTVALFQPQAGTESLIAYYGIDYGNITFPSSGDKVVVRSSMTDAADRYFLQNNGGARSDFGAGDLLDVGSIEVLDDGASAAVFFGSGNDASIFFDGTNLVLEPNADAPGAAVVNIPGKLEIISPIFPAVQTERVGSTTTSVLSGWRYIGTTTNDMADGHGASTFFAIKDDADVVNNIAFHAAVRFGGADNTGEWQQFVYAAGSAVKVFSVNTLEAIMMQNGGIFTTGGGRKRKTTHLAFVDSPYAVLASDHELFVDTTGGAVILNLPAGVDGTGYKIVNAVGAANVTVTPNGAETVRGVNPFALTPAIKQMTISFEPTEFWW